MRFLALIANLAFALMMTGCVTKQEAANSGGVAQIEMKSDAKPVAKVNPRIRTSIRTHFIEI
jgi:hypothetical protein